MSHRNGHAPEPIHRMEDAEERINRTLRVVFRREGFEVTDGYTPLSALFEDEDEKAMDVDSVEVFERNLLRRKMFSRFIDYITLDGIHPSDVTRRVYALIHAVKPEKLHNMSQSDLANLLGETRANHSFRLKKVFSRYLKGKGAKGYQASSQKGKATAQRCAEAQIGNNNRVKKLKRPPASGSRIPGASHDSY